MKNKVQMTVTMSVTEAQAVALKSMFDHWNYLAAIGSTRPVAFYVDGDGDFKPNCKVNTDIEITELTDELRKIASTKRNVTDLELFDFDAIAWRLEDDQ